MKVKATVNFAGALSMHKGEVKECNDKVILQCLLNCGYVEEVKELEEIQVVEETKEEEIKKAEKSIRGREKKVKSNED